MIQEFNVGDIVHKPHEQYSEVFVPMVVTGVRTYFKNIASLHKDIYCYCLESKDQKFQWVCSSFPEFIRESIYFGKFTSNLIDKEYQAWIEQLAGESK